MAIPGGSAYAFARDSGEGHFTTTERTFMRMTLPELDKVAFELDRYLREVRSQPADREDLPALQKRNRRIQRINSSLSILRAYRRKRKI